MNIEELVNSVSPLHSLRLSLKSRADFGEQCVVFLKELVSAQPDFFDSVRGVVDKVVSSSEYSGLLRLDVGPKGVAVSYFGSRIPNFSDFGNAKRDIVAVQGKSFAYVMPFALNPPRPDSRPIRVYAGD